MDMECFFSLEDFLSSKAKSISIFEENENELQWKICIIVDKKDVLAIKNYVVSHTDKIFEKEINPHENWLKKTYKHFPPIYIGSFCIYGSHTGKNVNKATYNLCIDAATAFGSGEHSTTQGCLLSMERLKEKKSNVDKVLDLGCGSGILAFAAKLLWKDSQVWACDNDKEAVYVAQKYSKMNKNETFIFLSDGFESNFLYGKTFDIIIANILANPLISLAQQVKEHTKIGGSLILSGILESQIDAIYKTYVDVGFKLVDKKIINGWATLSFELPEGEGSFHLHN